MKIAIDAMGGDLGPEIVVEGAVQALRDLTGIEKLFLVGDEVILGEALARHGGLPERMEILHADEIVGMNEPPAVAIRRKKNSSISRAADLVKSGHAQAMYSPGNTGAAVAAATLKWRTLKGVDRPAIAAVIPSITKPFIMLDAGANTDCNPHMLAQFAVMGSVYMREILGVARPSVGLLSIGGEQAKGNAVTKEAFQMLQDSDLDFQGNVESGDIFQGVVDVVVCDGFVGNVVLKTSEAVARAMGHWIKSELTANVFRMAGALLVKPALNAIKRKGDPATYGGAPLLGANGICIIGHGSSNATAVYNAVRVAGEAISHDLNHLIVDQVAALPPAG